MGRWRSLGAPHGRCKPRPVDGIGTGRPARRSRCPWPLAGPGSWTGRRRTPPAPRVDLPKTALQKALLGPVGRERQCVPVRGCGLRAAPEPSQQVGTCRMEVRVARERPLVGEPVHHRQADRRTVGERHGHGVVEADHRRGIELDEGLIQRGDLGPIRGGRIGGLVVEGRDGGLQLVRPDPTRRQDRLDERPALGDRGLVPAGPVLVLEQDEARRQGPTRASRRASWSSMSASNPAASGSSGSSETTVRASRIASALSSRRIRASPDDAA